MRTGWDVLCARMNPGRASDAAASPASAARRVMVFIVVFLPGSHERGRVVARPRVDQGCTKPCTWFSAQEITSLIDEPLLSFASMVEPTPALYICTAMSAGAGA